MSSSRCWEFTKGQFVIVEDSDLDAIAAERSRSIDLIQFVELAEVDPLSFDRAYYLAPSDDEVARRPYVLLLEALRDTGMAAVGRFVLWSKENLCLVRPIDGALVLETLYFAEDVRSSEEIQAAVGSVETNDAELAMARQLVESLAGPFDPDAFVNEHRTRVNAMLEAKRAGEDIVVAEDVETAAPVIDIMDALKESLERAKKTQPKAAKKKSSRKKKAATSK